MGRVGQTFLSAARLENGGADIPVGRADIPVCPVRQTGMSAPPISAFWLIVPCLACDFLMVPAIGLLEASPPDVGAPVALGIVGCVLAQGCLLAAWLAWSDGPFLRRLARHWIIATGLYLIWLVGLVLAFVRDPAAPHMAATVALGVPLVSIAAQFPLWLARQFWGWRLVRDGRADIPVCHDEQKGRADIPVCHPPEADKNVCPTVCQDDHIAADITPDRKLAIRHLMLATAVVAVSLALARLAPADGKDVWPVWAVSCMVATVISSITLLPAGAWLMRPVGQTSLSAKAVEQTFLSATLLRRGLAWSILYAAAWIAIVWIVLAAQWWFALPLAPRAIYIGISSLIFTFASTLILTALIARSRGYRLTARRKHVTE